LQMTPMIDIVFMLLIFFVWNFRIVPPEGDFTIRMPAASEAAVTQTSEFPLMKLELQWVDDAVGIALDGEAIASFAELRQTIRSRVGDAAGPSASSEQEIQIDAAYDLPYEYTMQAVTAISGYIDPVTKDSHTLIEKIQFAPLD